jgi:phage/plasmid-like protein (TIGR03299 family)
MKGNTMSHEVETMAYAGATPWHGLGVKVDAGMTPQQMMVAAGLDWTVKKVPLQNVIVGENGEVQTNTIPNQFSLIRETDNTHLSIVGRNYIPIQNDEVLDFFTKFVEAGHMKMDTAGSLRNGQKIWALASIEESFTLAGGDRVKGYLLLSQPHILGKGMQIRFTPIRVVCNNTLTFSLNSKTSKNETTEEATGEFRMSHNRAFDGVMKDRAEVALGISKELLNEFKENAEFLAKTRCSDEQADEIVRSLFETRSEDEMKSKREPRVIKRVLEAIEAQPGADMLSSKGTMWGVFNAVTYVVDHELGNERSVALDNAWFGARSQTKNKALEEITSYAKAA